MKKIALIAVVLSAVLLLASVTYAQESTATSSSSTNSGTTKESTLDRTNSGDKPADRETINQRKAALIEEAKSRREDFQSKLKELKNTKKQLILKRIEENLNKHNARQVADMKRHLERLSKIAGKLESRRAKIEVTGVDTASASAKLTEIKADIASLSAALDEQAAKNYTPTLTSTDSAALKLEVGATYQKLQADLKALRGQFDAIRDKMHEVVKLLRPASSGGGLKEDSPDESTKSAQ